jgi:hypothetical protein
MRDLPDSASLDHLRRQAKDQLVVLRSSNPAATLTEAQAAVARQYGFERWADLKGEVERRSATAPLVAPDELAERLAAAFGLGTVSGPMTHVERHWTGQAWGLRTTGGRWVLTALAGFVVPTAIETEAAFVERAIAAGVLAPVPVRTPAGSYVVEVDGTHWRIHRWMPLGPASPQPPHPEVAAEGGRILARIHGLDLEPPEPVVPWLTHRWGEAEWRKHVEAARAAGMAWADDLARAVPGFVALDAVRDPRDPNPRAVQTKAFHAPATVRLAGEGRLVAVGWEHASAVPKDWDLGASLMAWSETGDDDAYDLTAARAFLEGYRELAGDVEVTLAMFTSGVTGELNWMISRVNIALNDEDPVERELAERNVRVLARHPVQLVHVQRLADALTRL